MALSRAQLARLLDEIQDSDVERSNFSEATNRVWGDGNGSGQGESFRDLLDRLNNQPWQMDSRWGQWWYGHRHHNPASPEPADHHTTVAIVSDSPDGVVSGAKLTAHLNDLDGIKSAVFQWSVRENGRWHNIDDATSDTLVLTDNEAGKRVRVVATCTDEEGHVTTVSTPIAVAAVPEPQPEPQPEPEPQPQPQEPLPPADQPGTLGVESDTTDGFVSGATVTAQIEDADGVQTATYQWFVLENGEWIAIEGATEQTLTLTDDEAGKQVKVDVTYTDGAGHTDTLTTPIAVEDLPPEPVPEPEPVPVPVPDIPGTLTVDSSSSDGFVSGAKITANLTDVDGIATASYKWLVRDNGTTWKTIAGATSDSLTLDDSQVGKQVRVLTTYTDDGAHTSTISNTFTVDALPPPPPPDQPGVLTVSSTADGFIAGATITAHIADPDGVDLSTASYQWSVFESGVWKNIAGATSDKYTLRTSDIGKEIDVTSTYTDLAGHTTTIADPFTVTAPPAPPPPPNQAGTVAISSPNGLTEGAILTANVADADGLIANSVTYKWQENVSGSWLDIGSGKTHTIAFDEGGHQIRALASYSDNDGHVEAPISSPVNAVDVDRVGLLTVTSSSTNGFVTGATITTHLSDPDGIGSGPISYQWSSMGSDGKWHDISGATSATYKLTANDVGKQIDVTAQYVDGQGHQSTVADPFSVSEPPSSPPPSGGNGATLLWSAEFNAPLDMKSASNMDGLWAPVDFWQNINSGGYEDFAGTSWNINPNNPTFASYNPFSVQNGYLQIEASRVPTELVSPIQQEMQKQGQPGGVPEWMGGMLITNKDVIDFTYGYFEFRERVENPGKGMFPAMWFYSAKESGDPQGKASAEIDLYEIFGTPNRWSTTLHGAGTTDVGSESADPEAWHTYGMNWQPNLLEFYRDGEKLYSVTGPAASYFNDLELSIRVNFSMDAGWFPASAQSDSTTPQSMQMQIDYIRQYAELPFANGTG